MKTRLSWWLSDLRNWLLVLLAHGDFVVLNALIGPNGIEPMKPATLQGKPVGLIFGCTIGPR